MHNKSKKGSYSIKDEKMGIVISISSSVLWYFSKKQENMFIVCSNKNENEKSAENNWSNHEKYGKNNLTSLLRRDIIKIT